MDLRFHSSSDQEEEEEEDKEDVRKLTMPVASMLKRRLTSEDLRFHSSDQEEEDEEVVQTLNIPVASMSQRRRTAMHLSEPSDEKEKAVDGEGPKRLTRSAAPKHNKRPTVARLRALNRALKPVAPVSSTLRWTEAMMDISVLDLERQTEAEKDRESQSEDNDVAIPSSGASTITWDEVDHIQCIEPRGVPPEEPNTLEDQETPAEPDIVDDLCCSCFLFLFKRVWRRLTRRRHGRGRQ